jgi:hypothetical protein
VLGSTVLRDGDGSGSAVTMAYRIGFVMEQTLGHVTHTQNFRHWVELDAEVVPTWIPVSFSAPDHWNKAPLVRDNWTLRASLRARAQVQAVLRSERLDGLFFHTQVTALFAQRLMDRIPTVVSMDAQPRLALSRRKWTTTSPGFWCHRVMP